jgi:hypothetical protein
MAIFTDSFSVLSACRWCLRGDNHPVLLSWLSLSLFVYDVEAAVVHRVSLGVFLILLSPHVGPLGCRYCSAAGGRAYEFEVRGDLGELSEKSNGQRIDF